MLLQAMLAWMDIISETVQKSLSNKHCLDLKHRNENLGVAPIFSVCKKANDHISQIIELFP